MVSQDLLSAKLVITDTETGRTFDFHLVKPETRIGRLDTANDIVLNDGQVSREHAVIRLTSEAITLVDLSSANGTFFDGKRIRELQLKAGDIFKIGKFTLKCQDRGVSLCGITEVQTAVWRERLSAVDESSR